MFYNYLIFNMVTLSLRILLKYCVSSVETEVSNYGNTKKLMALIFLVSKNNFPNRIDISAKNSHVSILNDAKREYPCNLFLIVCRLPPTSFYCEACQRKYD